MTAGIWNSSSSKKSIREQVIAILSLIFAVILISIIAIPQVLEAFSRLIYRRRKSKDVRGKLAVITGGGSEMGRSISLKLAQLGCNLVIVEKNLSAIKDVAYEAKCIGVKAVAFEANVERLDEVQRLEEFLSAQEIDVNYLILTSELVEANKSVNDLVNGNFTANLFMTLKFVDLMQKQTSDGHIVMVSPSVGLSDLTAYSAVKLSVLKFMRSIREYLDAEKISHKIKTSTAVPFVMTNGKIVTNFIGNYINFLPLSTTQVVDEIIDGVVREEQLIEVPSNLMLVKRLARFCYKKVQSS